MKIKIVGFLFLYTFCTVAFSKSLSENHWEKVDVDFDQLVEQMERWARLDKDCPCPKRVLEQMREVALKKNKSEIWTRVYYWESYRDKKIAVDSVFSLLNKATKLADLSKYPYDVARIKMRMALFYSKQAKYAEAYRLYSDAVELFHEIGDHRLEACALNNMGNIFFFLNEYEDAICSFVKADSIFTTLGLNKERMECRLLLANIYIRTEKKSDAYALLKPVVENYQPGDYSVDLRIAVLSNYLSCLPEGADVSEYSEEAYRLAESMGDIYYMSVATVNRGWSMYYAGEVDSALVYARQVCNRIATWKGVYGIKEGVYKLYTVIFEDKQMWDSAYYYQKMYHVCLDSVRGKNVLTDIRRMEVKKEIDEHKLQAELEKQKSRQRTVFLLSVGTTLLGLLLVSVYIIYVLRRKMKREQLKQMEKDRAYILQLRKEKELIEEKNRELSSNAVLIMKKNEVLKDILKDIEEVSSEERGIDHKLEKKIQQELQFDNAWDSFKLHFDQVHPSFFLMLKQKYPRLTDNDLRLCAYIRTGLNNKQIAEMLLVQGKAVLQARYRLKKKMGLPDDMNISDYLKGISITDERV